MAGETWFKKGNEHYARRALGEAVHCWNEAASVFHHPEAYVALGKCFDFGEGVKIDQPKAFSFYKQGAKLGSAAGMYNLGMSLRTAAGVEKDDKKAMEYLRRAHKKGHPNACVPIAAMYLKGDGVKKSVRKAVKYFQIGARSDIPAAQYALGLLYISGIELPENKPEGLTLLHLAAAGGHSAAAQYLQEMGVLRPNAPKSSSFLSTPRLERGDASHLIAQLHSPSDSVKMQAAKTLAYLISGHKPNLNVLVSDAICPRLAGSLLTEHDQLFEIILGIVEVISQSEEDLHKQTLVNAGALPQLLRSLARAEYTSRILAIVFLLVDGSEERKKELRNLGMTLDIRKFSTGECDMTVKHGSFADAILEKQKGKQKLAKRSSSW
jgi:tetratricopeptide (TPR) repeat protein